MILQAKILEWAAIPFSRGSSWPRVQTQVSCFAGRFFTILANKEAPLCKVLRTKKLIIREKKWTRHGSCGTYDIQRETDMNGQNFRPTLLSTGYLVHLWYREGRSPQPAWRWYSPAKDCQQYTCCWTKGFLSFIFFFLIWSITWICISSLHRAHANLLCIVPLLVYVLPK